MISDELKGALGLLLAAVATWLAQVIRQSLKRKRDSLRPTDDSLPPLSDRSMPPLSERSRRRESWIVSLVRKQFRAQRKAEKKLEKRDEEVTGKIVIPKEQNLLIDISSPSDIIKPCKHCGKLFPKSQLCDNNICMKCGELIGMKGM